MTRLDTLPLEILLHILSYTDPIYCLGLSTYPLNALAATSRHLRTAVEEYARGQLIRHAGMERSKTASLHVCRRKLLRDMCCFCKKKTKRKACFYPMLTCCIPCDKQQFAKLTMTEARSETHLSKLDLFTPSPLHPHLPSLPTGMSSGRLATLLSTADVQARKAHIYALLGVGPDQEAFLRQRQAKHDRILKHLNVDYVEGEGWLEKGDIVHRPMNNVPKQLPKSMQTEESRTRYAEEALREEWMALGMIEEEGDFVALMAEIWTSVKRRRKRVQSLNAL